ncbi:MAG TPA: MBL fold metallo-hydrolase [Kofleriaceae bacterium]|nr:MBL fold metallo-hydrolase [Kofleriaceae bacterium]
MTLRLAGALRLETRAGATGNLETHAFVDGTEIRIDPASLDALTVLMAGRPLSQGQIAQLVGAGVLDDPALAPAAYPLRDAAVERLLLRPTVTLALEQPAQPSPVGPIIPESSAPVSMFVPPAVLGPIQQLAIELRRAWTEMLRCAHARGELVALDRATDILVRLARSAMTTLPGLADGFELAGDPPRLVPRRPLHREQIGFPLTGVALDDDRRRRRGPALSAPLPDAALGRGGLADVGRLLGLLHAGKGPVEIAAFLDETPRARGLFGRLVALGYLGPAPRRGALDGELAPGQVVHLGHAGLLANLGGACVAIDPWLCPASADDAPPPPGVGDLPPLAGIFLTHHHWDHLNVETLLQLDKRVPIYVPVQDDARTIAPDSARLLRYLGFAEVIGLRHGQTVTVGEGGQVTAVPFYGEDPTAIGYVGNCYVLTHQGASALVHVDSAIDRDGRSLVSTGACHLLGEQFGALSPVFATRRQERRTMLEYSWEALLRPADEWARPTENCATSPDFLADLCRALGARTLVLYSEGGAGWFPEGTNFMPGDEPALVEPYQYGWDPLDAVFDAVAGVGADTIVARPYQRFVIGGGTAGWAQARPRADRY